ncbi:glutathione S-transferase L3-like [Bidens hawaiensis]|uniref:glutathione S-transferase L3-like n=1 Tax=Bidens hawaiensis TaxID=980011 RepID=UPI00404AB6A4
MSALNLSCYYYLISHSPPLSSKNITSNRSNNNNNNNNLSSISTTHPLAFHHKRPLNNNNHNNNLLLVLATTMATSVQDDLPPALDSTSKPPSVFYGTTRLYISYTCPYAQRAWITRNCKAFPLSEQGLQETIKLIPIDLKNRPDWYKEKVYPPNKVPALEHNNEVKGESLDLIKYIDANFEGPSLYPEDTIKQEFGEELLSYTDTFYKSATTSFKGGGVDDAAAAFDYIEKALSKFDDGPFFLGQFSLVDIAYAPFIERFQPYLLDVKNYDIKVGRPKLAAWIEEMNKNDDFNQTRRDPKELVESYKKRYLSPA